MKQVNDATINETKQWYIMQVKMYLDSKHIEYEVKEAQTHSIYFYIGDPSQLRAAIRIADHNCGHGNVRTLRCDQGIKHRQGKIKEVRHMIDLEVNKMSLRRCYNFTVN